MTGIYEDSVLSRISMYPNIKNNHKNLFLMCICYLSSIRNFIVFFPLFEGDRGKIDGDKDAQVKLKSTNPLYTYKACEVSGFFSFIVTISFKHMNKL